MSIQYAICNMHDNSQKEGEELEAADPREKGGKKVRPEEGAEPSRSTQRRLDRSGVSPSSSTVAEAGPKYVVPEIKI